MVCRRRRARLSDTRRFLEESTSVRVRFQEVDSMKVVWHGHYINYFEDARRAFGKRWDLDYPVFLENGVVAPLVHIEVDFHAPARQDDSLEVTARLCEPEGAKLEFEYDVVRDGDGKLLAAGSSVQVFTSMEGTLALTLPDFMVERLRRWESAWTPPGNPGRP